MPRLRGLLYTVEQGKRLRIEETPAEKIFWNAVRRKALGYKFRRQHGIGPFIVDFYCDAARLIVELDGAIHHVPDVQLRDQIREKYLSENGYLVLRFRNVTVTNDLPNVLAQITTCITSRLSPSHGGVGGGK